MIFCSRIAVCERFCLVENTFVIFQSSNRALYYLGFPHVTKLDEVTAGNLVFPAITICNLNEFCFKKITKNDMYHVGKLVLFINRR